MTTRRSGSRNGPQSLLGWLIPLVVVGLAIADFIRDGQIDKFLIGALLIFGLGALGWRLDDIVGERISNQIDNALPGGAGDPPSADNKAASTNPQEGNSPDANG